MGLKMSEKKAITKEVARRYKKAKKGEKGKILDEFVKTTGNTRNGTCQEFCVIAYKFSCFFQFHRIQRFVRRGYVVFGYIL